MKIAICLSGYMRGYKDNVKSLLTHVASEHDADIFVHTWDKMGLPSAWHGCDDAHPDDTDNHLAEIHKLLSPKAICVEPVFSWDLSSFARPGLQRFHENFPMMFYKIHKCDELRKESEAASGREYDLVIRTRPDIRYLSRINMGVLDKDKLHIPQMPSYYVIAGKSYNDQIAIGTPCLMSIYSAAADKVSKYVNAMEYYGAERFLGWYLDGSNVCVDTLDAQYLITRMNGRSIKIP